MIIKALKRITAYGSLKTYNSVRELEDVLMYYVLDSKQPLDFDDIAHIIMDIVDYATEDAINDYKQSRDEF